MCLFDQYENVFLLFASQFLSISSEAVRVSVSLNCHEKLQDHLLVVE